MTTVGLVMLIAGVVILFARELAAVRLDEVRSRPAGGLEVLLIVALLLLAPRVVELLT
jgi:hypothetical protein